MDYQSLSSGSGIFCCLHLFVTVSLEHLRYKWQAAQRCFAYIWNCQFGWIEVWGYSTDKWGVPFTLVGGMTLHIVTLILLSLVTHSYIGVLVILILWSFAAWSTGPTQQFHLATIEPEMSGVLLSMNQSMMQFAMAVGAGIGGFCGKRIIGLDYLGWCVRGYDCNYCIIADFQFATETSAKRYQSIISKVLTSARYTSGCFF